MREYPRLMRLASGIRSGQSVRGDGRQGVIKCMYVKGHEIMEEDASLPIKSLYFWQSGQCCPDLHQFLLPLCYMKHSRTLDAAILTWHKSDLTLPISIATFRQEQLKLLRGDRSGKAMS
jgi:hypothetical protein